MEQSGHGWRVLVADDEGAIAETTAMILNASGYDARAVSSGEAAIETARQFHPDFLISDLGMGATNGIEAATQIRSMWPECKVVVFSASMVDHDTREKLGALGFDFLRKPLHPSQLLARLHK